MNLGWIIELILPGLIHSNERVRDMVRFSLFYCLEPFAFTLPVNVAAMIESMKKNAFIAQNKEIIRIEILKFFYIISIKHSHSNIIYPSFIDKSISLLMVRFLPPSFLLFTHFRNPGYFEVFEAM